MKPCKSILRATPAILLFLVTAAAADDPDAPGLVVNVAEFPPCVVKDGGVWTGFEIELWEAVAKDAGIAYTYKQADFATVLANVKDGKADVGIAGITTSSDREAAIDFSHHTLDSGLQILVPERGADRGVSIFSFFKMFGRSLSSPAVIEFGICLAIFFLLTGHIVWLIERKHSMARGYFAGIADAIYFCIVTSSTVGYGDITPKRTVGRICSVALILTGIAWFSNFTALLAANYTAEKLEYSVAAPADLKGKLVGTQAGTTSVAALERLGARVAASPTIDQAYDRLLKGEIDAVVYDLPSVRNFVKTSGNGRVAAVGAPFNAQYYGFIFPPGSPALKKVNRSILRLRENGTYDRIYHRWF